VADPPGVFMSPPWALAFKNSSSSILVLRSTRYDRGAARVCRDDIRLSACPIIRLQLLPVQ